MNIVKKETNISFNEYSDFSIKVINFNDIINGTNIIIFNTSGSMYFNLSIDQTFKTIYISMSFIV